jgi:hypothetical protein
MFRSAECSLFGGCKIFDFFSIQSLDLHPDPDLPKEWILILIQ